MKRVGLTMRVVRAESYAEQRDAIAQDWSRFLALALPDCQWMPVPNLGPEVVDFVRSWGLEGLILTGGNDLGEAPTRDSTESALLRFALEGAMPVFGVCRGLHMIQHFSGGTVRACSREVHIATRHTVRFEPTLGGMHDRIVNSFHGLGVRLDELAPDLLSTAVSEDGWIEGIVHRFAPLTAVQWHPERNVTTDPEDVLLLRHALGLEPLPNPSDPLFADTINLLTPFTFPPCVP